MDHRATISLLIVLMAAVAIPAGATPTATSSACIDSPSGVESDLATVGATVGLSPNSSHTVRITYDTRSRDGGFGVKLPDDVAFVSSRGFSYDESEHYYRYTGGETPYIEYRIGKEGQVRRYASSDDWIFAPVPTHVDVGVTLRPRPAGVIGDRFLYLGNYTRYTTTVGCHESASSWLLRANSTPRRNESSKPSALRHLRSTSAIGTMR